MKNEQNKICPFCNGVMEQKVSHVLLKSTRSIKMEDAENNNVDDYLAVENRTYCGKYFCTQCVYAEDTYAKEWTPKKAEQERFNLIKTGYAK